MGAGRWAGGRGRAELLDDDTNILHGFPRAGRKVSAACRNPSFRCRDKQHESSVTQPARARLPASTHAPTHPSNHAPLLARAQNKIDLVKEDAARLHYAQVRGGKSGGERCACVLCICVWVLLPFPSLPLQHLLLPLPCPACLPLMSINKLSLSEYSHADETFTCLDL